VTQNEIFIARKWEDWEIEEGRAEDKANKEKYFKKQNKRRRND